MNSQHVVDRDHLTAAIDDGVRWLCAQGRFGGRFEYGYDVHGVPMQRYNVARHAGALYALAQHYERSNASAVADAFAEGSRYLATACIREVPGTPGAYALWGDPEGSPHEAKLGAAGLALAAWCGMDGASAWRPPSEVLSGIGAFIAHLQDGEGHFISKYDAVKGPQRQWESLYYPGEAALGLVRLFSVDENPDWLDGAENALLYLARKRKASGRCEPDHWALLATEALWPYAMQRQILLDHAIMVVETMLAEAQPSGALTRCGRSTPTTTRLEGILAVRRLLPPGHPLRRRMEQALPRAIAYSLTARVAGGVHDGAVQRAPATAPDPKAAELRIDYAQHAVSAWMAWRDGATRPDEVGTARC